MKVTTFTSRMMSCNNGGDEEEMREVHVKHPRKRNYRQRAHSNPLSDHSFEYPVRPETMNWKEILPTIESADQVQWYLH